MTHNKIIEPCTLATKSFVGWLKWIKESRIKKAETVYTVWNAETKKFDILI